MNSLKARAPLRVLGSLLALLAVVFVAGSTVYAVFANYNTVPLSDHWETIELYKKQVTGTLGLHDFWAQHNEHRILLPRILILADYALERGTGYYLIGLMLVLQALHALLLSRAFAREGGAGRKRILLFTCLAFILCLWLKQRENFLWTFQIAWMLNGVFASLAFYAAAGVAARSTEGALWRRLALAAFCCFVTVYTLASGVVVPGIVFLLLWKAKLPRRFLAAWTVFSIALAASYLAGYASPSHHPSPLDALHLKTVAYFFGYLGNLVLVRGPAVLVGLSAGVLGLAGFAYLAFRFFTGKNPPYYTRFAFGGAAYVVFLAAMTATGRHTFGVMQSASSRYASPVVIFWLLLLSWGYAECAGRKPVLAKTVAWIVGILAIYALSTQFLLIQEMRVAGVEVNEASLAVQAGVGDSAALRRVYPAEKVVWERDPYLREQGLFHYVPAWSRTRGLSFSKTYTIEASALEGRIEERRRVESPIRPGVYLKLRVRESAGSSGGAIVFARRDTVVGFARSARRGCEGCYSGYVGGSLDSVEAFSLGPLTEAGAPLGGVRRIHLR